MVRELHICRASISHCHACSGAGFLNAVKIIDMQLDDSILTCLLRPLIHCNRTIRELHLKGSLKTVTKTGYVALSQMLLTNGSLQRLYIDCFTLSLLDGMATACIKYAESASAALPRVSAALHFETPPLGGLICLPVINDARAAAVAVLISCTASLIGMYCNVSLVSSSSMGYAWLLQANAIRPNNVTIYLKSVRTTDETLPSPQRWYSPFFSVLIRSFEFLSYRAGCNCAIGPPLLANDVQIPLNVSSALSLVSRTTHIEIQYSGFASRCRHQIYLQSAWRQKWTFILSRQQWTNVVTAPAAM